MNKKSFSMTELLIVILIISVLAAAAFPIIRISIKKAILQEAIATMRMVQNAEERYFAEHGQYRWLHQGSVEDFAAIGIDINELDGTYFSNKCYWLVPDTNDLHYEFYCEGSLTRNVPRANEVANQDVWVIMDDEGRCWVGWGDYQEGENPQNYR